MVHFWLKQTIACSILWIALSVLGLHSASGTEWSGGISLPPGGIINSLYLSGTPIGGLTIKAKTDDQIEYTAFVGGGFGLIAVDKIIALGGQGLIGNFGKDVYSIVGFSVPFALNVGGGFYIVQTGNFGLRLQYVTLVTGGGTILGSDSAGPGFIGWTGLLASLKF